MNISLLISCYLRRSRQGTGFLRLALFIVYRHSRGSTRFTPTKCNEWSTSLILKGSRVRYLLLPFCQLSLTVEFDIFYCHSDSYVMAVSLLYFKCVTIFMYSTVTWNGEGTKRRTGNWEIKLISTFYLKSSSYSPSSIGLFPASPIQLQAVR